MLKPAKMEAVGHECLARLGAGYHTTTASPCLTGVSLKSSGALPAIGFALNEVNLQKAVSVWEERTKKQSGTSRNNLYVTGLGCICHSTLGIYYPFPKREERREMSAL